MAHRPIGSRDTGSALAELAFAIAGLSLDVEAIPYLEPGPGRDRLLALNPLGQVPTLVLPAGQVMTESGAASRHGCLPLNRTIPTRPLPSGRHETRLTRPSRGPG